MAMPEGAGQRPTIYDVADRAGVSKSLVSLVLQGNPGSASRAGPRCWPRSPNSVTGRAGPRPMLASHRTKSVEVVIDDYRNLSFVGLLAGIGRNWPVTATTWRSPTPGSTRTWRPWRRQGRASAVDQPGRLDHRRRTRRRSCWTCWTGPTVVAGWRATIPAGADLVANDDEMGGRLAADHLLQLGHRRIGHLTGASGPAAHRRAGFVDRCCRPGLQPMVSGELGGTAEEDGYRAAVDLLDENPEITAIFAANDTMALGALAAIRARGLERAGRHLRASATTTRRSRSPAIWRSPRSMTAAIWSVRPPAGRCSTGSTIRR